MTNGNEVSMWLVGAKRTRTMPQIVAHIRAQMAMDVDGREFWAAALEIAERTK